MPTKTPKEALAEADQYSKLTVEIDSLKAQLKEALLSVQIHYAPQIELRQKERNKIKARVKNWFAKYSKLIFPKKGTGEHKTGLSKVAWTKTPEAIVPIVKGTKEEDLVELALAKGHEDAVRVSHSLNRDHLATLEDDELAELGLKKEAGFTLNITPLADTGDKKKSA